MVINPYSTLHLAKKNRELAEKLQSDMESNFLEHAMYDINDALTSILALCDMEQMKAVPKVKGYIERVNDLLSDVQINQDDTTFNVNHLLRNVIDVIKDNFKNEVKILSSFTTVKALVNSNQKTLERILIYLFIELMTVTDTKSDQSVNVSLIQKGSEALIRIKREGFSFSHEQLKEVGELQAKFSGKMEISKSENVTLITINLPLTFESKGIFNLPPTPTSKIKVVANEKTRKPIQSFAKDDV